MLSAEYSTFKSCSQNPTQIADQVSVCACVCPCVCLRVPVRPYFSLYMYVAPNPDTQTADQVSTYVYADVYVYV